MNIPKKYIIWIRFTPLVLILLVAFIIINVQCQENQHLPMFDELEFYNEIDRFSGFHISEQKYNDTLFYRLENSKYGITVLVDETETKAIIQKNENTFELPICGLFSSVDAIDLFICDLTGDGAPEVIYIHSTGGVGSIQSEMKIVNLDTLEIIPIENYTEYMIDNIDIEFQYASNNIMVFKIVSSFSPTVEYGGVYIDERNNHDNPYKLVYDTSYETISVEDGRLSVQVGFTVTNAQPGCYLGTIIGELNYNSDINIFQISPSSLSLKVTPPELLN